MYDHGEQETLLSLLNQQITNKNPKIASNTLNFLTVFLNNYGAARLENFQTFQKNLALLGVGARNNIKTGLTNLYIELFRWIGDSVFDLFSMGQVKDQVKKFTKTYVKEQMRPKRAPKGKNLTNECQLNEQDADNPQSSETIDVLNKYDSKWTDMVLGLEKWKQKKQHLDEFIRKTKNKRIEPRQTFYFITFLKQLILDNNINLMQAGMKIFNNLCCGLQKHFHKSCRALVTTIFNKLKDKRKETAEEAVLTIENMARCLSMDELMEDIKVGLDDKAPNMKIQTLKVLEVFIKGYKSDKAKTLQNNIKILTSKLGQLAQDGNAQVRDYSFTVLCKIKCIYGMGFFGDKLRTMPPNKLHALQKQNVPGYQLFNPKIMQHKQCFQKIQSESEQMASNEPIKNQKPTKIVKKNPVTAKQKKQVLKSLQNQTLNRQNIDIEPIAQVNSVVAKKSPAFLIDLSSNNEQARLHAYNQLIEKNMSNCWGIVRQRCQIRQSSVNNLKAIINVVKHVAYYHELQVQHVQFLLFHNWTKNKNLLMQYLQTTSVSQQAYETILRAGFNIQINQTEAAKNLFNIINDLIAKMTSPMPERKIEAFQRVLEALNQISRPLSENQIIPYAQLIANLTNILKCRIQEKDLIIAQAYLRLVSALVQKGVLVKHKVRALIPIAIRRLEMIQQNTNCVFNFLKSLFQWNRQFCFSMLICELTNPYACQFLIDFINTHIDQFIASGQIKAFIIPLLTTISKKICIQKCEGLLDQIIEISGTDFLEKIVKDTKLQGVQDYLRKWDVLIDIPSQYFGGNIFENRQEANSNNYAPPFAARHPLLSKSQRIVEQLENPWPIQVSVKHIRQLLKMMQSFGDPLNSLSQPIGQTVQHYKILASLKTQFLIEWSDIFCKWIFWRMQIQRPNGVIQTIKFAKRLINQCELQECEIIILRGAMMNCLQQNGQIILKQICQLNNVVNQKNQKFKMGSFNFWLNSLTDPYIPVAQVLKICMECFSDLIGNQLVTLSRISRISRNVQFMNFLKEKFGLSTLNIYGFNTSVEAHPKTFRIESIIPSNISEKDINFYLGLFDITPSEQFTKALQLHIYQIQPEIRVETHLKIMYIINVPYLKGQLSFLNIYEYYSGLSKSIVYLDFAPYLRDLVRCTSYFMLDLDPNKQKDNFKQVLQFVNRILLFLMDKAPPKHVFQVLFMMIQDHIRNDNGQRAILLMQKCMGRVVKANLLNADRQKAKQTIKYFLTTVNSIVRDFNLSQNSLILEKFSVVTNQLQNLSNTLRNCTQQFFNNAEVHPYFKIFLEKYVINGFSAKNTPSIENVNQNQRIVSPNDQNALRFCNLQTVKQNDIHISQFDRQQQVAKIKHIGKSALKKDGIFSRQQLVQNEQ